MFDGISRCNEDVFYLRWKPLLPCRISDLTPHHQLPRNPMSWNSTHASSLRFSSGARAWGGCTSGCLRRVPRRAQSNCSHRKAGLGREGLRAVSWRTHCPHGSLCRATPNTRRLLPRNKASSRDGAVTPFAAHSEVMSANFILFWGTLGGTGLHAVTTRRQGLLGAFVQAGLHGRLHSFLLLNGLQRH